MIKRIVKILIFILGNPLVKNERFQAFWRYLKFHILFKNGELSIIPFIKGKLILKKGAGSQANYYTYLQDFEEMLFLLHYLNENDQFIDIGANIGTYSILASKLTNCLSIAFEPSLNNFNILSANISLNNLKDKIKLYNIALGSKNEMQTIGFKGELTYITSNKDLSLQNVNVKQLDTILDYANLIKIDVEGYEENVLKGAIKILKNKKTNALIVEFAGYNRYGSSNKKVHDLLIKNNFNPIKYSPYNRSFIKLKNFRQDKINTIYIRDFKLAMDRIIHSAKYKIGNQFI